MKHGNGQHWDPNFLQDYPNLLYQSAIERQVRSFLEWPELSDVNKLMQKFSVKDEADRLITFVNNPPKRRRNQFPNYSEHFIENAEVYCREKHWHDFFNILSWAHLPNIKSTLCKSFVKNSTRKSRSPIQDLIARFDEGGMVIVSTPEQVIHWQYLLSNPDKNTRNISIQSSIAPTTYIPLGHALQESANANRWKIRGMGLVLEQDKAFFNLTDAAKLKKIDSLLSKMMSEKGFWNQPFFGFPLQSLKIEDYQGPLCSAPFEQLLLSPSGATFPCCFHFGEKLGSIKTQTLEEIWHGKKINKLREQHANHKPKSCRSRMLSLHCHENFANDQTLKVPKTPRRLDIRLNGTCNLRCKMCDVWQQPRDVYRSTEFWARAPETVFPHLREIDILGGEPFIQPDVFQLINKIKGVNDNCIFNFVSNGHYRFSSQILNTVEDIKIGWLQISLDSLESDTYQSIRRGGRLALVLNTLNQWQKFRFSCSQPFTLKLSMCVLRQNWKEVPKFIDFCDQQKAIPEFQFAFYDPSKRSSLLYAKKTECEEVLNLISSLPLEKRTLLRCIESPLKHHLTHQWPR